MKAIRLYIPSIPFLLLGIFLFIGGTISVIKINLGGTIENVFWFVDGMLIAYLLLQIGMRFAKECKCDAECVESEQ